MSQETPPDDLIRYDVMVQEALLGVVRKVMADTARAGLQGEHHFYITFRSHAPGVKLSARLREKHPEEMTIVLQHQYWDLQVSDVAFEVGLSFGGISERLVVPFEALTGFYDPSVQFGLKFAADEAQADNDSADDETSVKDRLDAIAAHEKGATAKKNAPDKEKQAEAPALLPVPEKKPREAKPKAKEPARAEESPPPDDSPGGGAQVVSLESFRKKK